VLFLSFLKKQEDAPMISGIYSSLSALFSFGKKVESNANNIANANTDGYKKTRVTLQETLPQGVVEPEVEKVNTPGPVIVKQTATGMQPVELSNVDLATELPTMQMSQRLFEANLKSLKAQLEMEDEVVDLKA
jgi:flagellar basal body rod protein FlgG